MYRLRCTVKLLARLKVAPEREPVEPTTRLGDWYAKVVYVGRTPLILAVSDRTLRPVLFRARDLREIVPRLAEGVGQVLRTIGAPAEAIDRELAAMNDATINTTANRRVLGSMTDFAFLMKAWADQDLRDDDARVLGSMTDFAFLMKAWADQDLRDDDALVALAVRLAKTPCSPIGMERPRDAAIALLRRDDALGVQ